MEGPLLSMKTQVRTSRKCIFYIESSQLFPSFAIILQHTYFVPFLQTPLFAVFTTFIMNEADVPSKPYPRDIMNWSESDVFGPIFNEGDSSGALSKVCDLINFWWFILSLQI